MWAESTREYTLCIFMCPHVCSLINLQTGNGPGNSTQVMKQHPRSPSGTPVHHPLPPSVA